MTPLCFLTKLLKSCFNDEKSILKKPEILVRPRFYVGYTNWWLPWFIKNLETFIICCFCGLPSSAKGKTEFRSIEKFREYEFLTLKNTHISICLE